MKDRKEKFLAEYEALCRKHGLFVRPGEHGDDLAYVSPLTELPAGDDLEFWFTEHLNELKKSVAVGFQPDVVVVLDKIGTNAQWE